MSSAWRSSRSSGRTTPEASTEVVETYHCYHSRVVRISRPTSDHGGPSVRSVWLRFHAAGCRPEQRWRRGYRDRKQAGALFIFRGKLRPAAAKHRDPDSLPCMGSTVRGSDSTGPGTERSRHRWWIVAAGSVALLGTGALWYTRSRIPPPPQSDLRRAGYVDSSACSECHANVAKTYRLAGMARTFHRPSEQTVIEDFKRANRGAALLFYVVRLLLTN